MFYRGVKVVAAVNDIPHCFGTIMFYKGVKVDLFVEKGLYKFWNYYGLQGCKSYKYKDSIGEKVTGKQVIVTYRGKCISKEIELP